MRETILSAAEAMVQSRGLNGVSFQDLANAVGLSKASVFHHFKSREALAQALIERCKVSYGATYDEIVDREISAPEKLEALASVFRETTANGKICLLAALSGSRSTLPEAAQQKLSISANATIGRFTRVFEQGRREGSLAFDGEPRHAATAFLGMLQGLQSLVKATGDVDAFSQAAGTYIAALRE